MTENSNLIFMLYDEDYVLRYATKDISKLLIHFVNLCKDYSIKGNDCELHIIEVDKGLYDSDYELFFSDIYQDKIPQFSTLHDNPHWNETVCIIRKWADEYYLKERIKRQEEKERQLAKQEERERAEYERLKAKYENKFSN